MVWSNICPNFKPFLNTCVLSYSTNQIFFNHCTEDDNDLCRQAETCGGPVVTKVSFFYPLDQRLHTDFDLSICLPACPSH